jgi:hypothetical protein
MTDIDKALLDPSAVFQSPEDVLGQAELSREQKIDILRRWEYDARELAVADEEGMPVSQADLLDRILQALHTLGVWPDPDRTAPTKQGGHGGERYGDASARGSSHVGRKPDGRP